ncbi:MAG TPA: Zn-dependent hydrolase [Acetomicrobium flavidum]|uniref:Allantoate deiminase n=1 Tax=Acetomicrobium flavidum TaxID=49896 RepID=A0ABY1JAJ4_9BACT|nr:allantoate deiminase [Acetomicrobium flavidum]HOJ82605.1 Zn-dependent hydrolase [Acetomicrobium flavidum]HOM31396.1 Zn-dependent hydrolase [Acetomicrobium flavidum]HOP88077.1 Zn-dependent hydrolase [Acetomicrobium flavidum]HPP14718.1 Zn-dependent hydrolase [Acetomicrobium flavidum]
MLETNLERIRHNLETLSTFNSTPDHGCTRLSFSHEHRRALDFLTEACTSLGMDVVIDPVGNFRARLKGSSLSAPAVMCGSHIDTVLHGGKFDGAAGVVAALEALTVIKEQEVSLRHPLELIAFVEEEGASFGGGLVGSKALVGQYTVKDLMKIVNDEGVSFYEAAKRFGLNPDDLENYVIKKGDVKALIELHIEQGNVLYTKSIPLGVVEAIVGIRQLSVTLTGMANHAGTTPMNLRHDALAAASKLISFVEHCARHEAFDTTVATVGKIHCFPNVTNVIPGKVVFSVDIRDIRDEGISKVEQLIREEVKRISSEYGLQYSISLVGDSKPVKLSEEVISVIQRTAEEVGVKYLKMHSGAGHDSAILTEVTDVGMIFVPSIEGISHAPDENTTFEDLKTGCDVLVNSLVKLAQ